MRFLPLLLLVSCAGPQRTPAPQPTAERLDEAVPASTEPWLARGDLLAAHAAGGRLFLLEHTADGNRAVRVLEAGESEPRRLPTPGEIDALWPSPDGSFLAVARTLLGENERRIRLLDSELGTPLGGELQTRAPRFREEFDPPWTETLGWLPRSAGLCLLVAADGTEGLTLARFAQPRPTAVWSAPADCALHDLRLAEDGTLALVSAAGGDGRPSRAFQVDLEGGPATELTALLPGVDSWQPLGASGPLAWWLLDAGTERSRVVAFDRRPGLRPPLEVVPSSGASLGGGALVGGKLCLVQRAEGRLELAVHAPSGGLEHRVALGADLGRATVRGSPADPLALIECHQPGLGTTLLHLDPTSGAVTDVLRAISDGR